MDRLSDECLRQQLKIRDDSTFRVVSRESANLEYKESYSFSNLATYFRTMSAFANNAGGYLIFGVTDSPRTANGLSESSLRAFESLRVEEFTDNLNDFFDPEVSWEHRTFEFSGRSFGVIYVHELRNRPCICKKHLSPTNPNSMLREGDIFYRYGGRTERIHFPELKKIIESTRLAEQQLWLDLVRNTMTIGVENASLLDLRSGRLGGQNGAIVLDESLLDRLRFVEQGRFSEVSGAPTLRLIGDIQEIRTSGILLDQPQFIELRGIETHDVVSTFLEGREVVNPLDYLRRVCSENSPNYPVFYFAFLSGLSRDELTTNLSTYRTTASAKDKVLRRLRGERIAETALGTSEHPSSVRRRALRTQLLEQGTLGNIQNVEAAKDVIAVVCSMIDAELRQHAAELKEIFHFLYFEWIEDVDNSLRSQLRRAIAKMDQAFFEEYLE